MVEVDYTPSMHYFRRQYANRFTDEADVIAAEARFDAALAAHDAEVRAGEAAHWAQAVIDSGEQGERIGAARAGVVAEEPEGPIGGDTLAQLVMDHRFAGLCPDAVDGWDRRDPECAACSALDALGAEEPEWEIGVSYSTSNGPSVDGYRVRSYMKVGSIEQAQEFAALVERPMIQKRTKAVPAGEWISVPVKQGDESE